MIVPALDAWCEHNGWLAELKLTTFLDFGDLFFHSNEWLSTPSLDNLQNQGASIVVHLLEFLWIFPFLPCFKSDNCALSIPAALTMEFEAQYDCLPGLFPSWVYYILASAVVAVFALTLHRVMSSDLYMIPGPAIARLTHWWLKWHVISGRRVQYIHELHQTYGSVVLIAPNEVAIADVAAAREIHRAGNGYVKSDFYQKLVGGANHNVFTMVDPEEHAKRRKLLSQPFNKSAIMRVEDVVRSKVDLAVAKIKRDAEVGKADILKWFTFMATDVLGELSFGESFDMLHKEEVSSNWPNPGTS